MAVVIKTYIDANEYTAKFTEKLLHAIGIEFVAKAIEKVPVDSGALKSSIGYRVDGFVCTVFAIKEYAAIQEFGGEITPQQKQALAVPVHPDAKNKSPRDFQNLIFIKRANRPPLLVRKIGKGNAQRMDIMFVLVKKVHIPAQPFLFPAAIEVGNNIENIVARIK